MKQYNFMCDKCNKVTKFKHLRGNKLFLCLECKCTKEVRRHGTYSVHVMQYGVVNRVKKNLDYEKDILPLIQQGLSVRAIARYHKVLEKHIYEVKSAYFKANK
jgi:hypothetical protein